MLTILNHAVQDFYGFPTYENYPIDREPTHVLNFPLGMTTARISGYTVTMTGKNSVVHTSEYDFSSFRDILSKCSL